MLQVLTDPSGNSFLENPHAPKSDPFREVSHFLRTREQDHDLGIYTADEVASKEAADDDPAAAAEDTELTEDLREEVLNFLTNCPECGAPADTKMKLTSKLHLKSNNYCIVKNQGFHDCLDGFTEIRAFL